MKFKEALISFCSSCSSSSDFKMASLPPNVRDALGQRREIFAPL
jgi:hypothetical protein